MVFDNDTSMGGAPNRFPSTRWSMILEARDPFSPAYRDAIDHLCRQYWKPVYVFLRMARSLGNEEAKDLTQEFFLEVLEGNLVGRFEPHVGSFRSYLHGALRIFLLGHHDRASAQKRGGGRKILSLEDAALESLPISADPDPQTAFDRQWARSLLDLALDDLRQELAGTDKEVYLRVFERYELPETPDESVTYARLAWDFTVQESDISVWLAHCRRRLRKLLVDRIRDTVADEGESIEELTRMVELLTPSSP